MEWRRGKLINYRIHTARLACNVPGRLWSQGSSVQLFWQVRPSPCRKPGPTPCHFCSSATARFPLNSWFFHSHESWALCTLTRHPRTWTPPFPSKSSTEELTQGLGFLGRARRRRWRGMCFFSPLLCCSSQVCLSLYLCVFLCFLCWCWWTLCSWWSQGLRLLWLHFSQRGICSWGCSQYYSGRQMGQG